MARASDSSRSRATSRPFSSTGRHEIRCCFISSMASRVGVCGPTVTTDRCIT